MLIQLISRKRVCYLLGLRTYLHLKLLICMTKFEPLLLLLQKRELNTCALFMFELNIHLEHLMHLIIF